MHLNLKRPLAFFDLETTGTNIVKDRIIEISILKVMPDGQEHSKTYLVNPTIPIPPDSTTFHGFKDEDVEDKPTFADIAKKLYLFLEDCDLGGFNSNRFDIPVLMEEFLRCDIDFSLEGRKLIDVQVIFHMMEKRTLEAAYKFYCDKELVNAHSAEADVKATMEVFLAQLEHYGGKISNDMEKIHNLVNLDQFVDLGRRIINIKNVPHFNFGKHKGRPVSEVLKNEPQYYDWIMKGDFLQHTKKKLKELKIQLDQSQV